MKRTLLSLSLLVATMTAVQAQQPFSFELKGFVNPHYYADSRAVVGSREDMMLFYPKPILLDDQGRDTNDGWQADMIAITARLGLTIHGPDMLNAKSSAYIEGDFTGATNTTINNLRLRHAYFRLDWMNDQNPKHSLLIGQYWHPMVIHEIMPMTNPLNMGAPFHPYSRQPLVRYEFHLKAWEIIGSAVWQLDNMSQGLLYNQKATSTAFARHSLLPELNMQLRHNGKRLFWGMAFNLKNLQPVVPTFTGKIMHQPSFSLFGSYTGKHITLRSQAIFNNTLYEIASLGGYTLFYNETNHDWTTRDEVFTTFWIDAERNHGHWRPGIFAGIAFNTTPAYKTDYDPNISTYRFGRGFDFGGLWRVQPRLSYYTLNGLSFTAEAEYTVAGYYGQPVGNLRLSLSMTYSFKHSIK